jgi:hypothetical protein
LKRKPVKVVDKSGAIGYLWERQNVASIKP